MKTKNSISDDVQKEIALRAYYIWEREGRPEGREAAHWAAAEAEILSEQRVRKAPTAKPPAKAKSNGSAKSAKAKTEPAKPTDPIKAAVAAKAVKTKKTAKTKKPAPKA